MATTRGSRLGQSHDLFPVAGFGFGRRVRLNADRRNHERILVGNLAPTDATTRRSMPRQTTRSTPAAAARSSTAGKSLRKRSSNRCAWVSMSIGTGDVECGIETSPQRERARGSRGFAHERVPQHAGGEEERQAAPRGMPHWGPERSRRCRSLGPPAASRGRPAGNSTRSRRCSPRRRPAARRTSCRGSRAPLAVAAFAAS